MKRIVSFFGDSSEIFVDLNEKARTYAKEKGLEYVWAPQTPFNREKVIEELQKSDAGIIDVEPYGEETFKEIGDRCKLLVRFGVGYDKVDLKAASNHGISIYRTAGANTLGVAEMAVSLILACRRKLQQVRTYIDTCNWQKDVVNETIGSTIGIVGFGAIGQAVAKLLSGFDCRIIAYDPFPQEKVLKECGVELVTLDELFTESDAITLHLPYCPETHNLIGKELLGKMKSTSVIVNTARGNIIDEDALYDVLSQGKIAGAGLDVFGVEPLPLSSSLLTLDNIVMTPHLSSQTYESLWRIYEMAIDIASGFYNGEDVPNLLNKDMRK
jgi:phosphoglycerate dehydrogenase-like enzyme